VIAIPVSPFTAVPVFQSTTWIVVYLFVAEAAAHKFGLASESD